MWLDVWLGKKTKLTFAKSHSTCLQGHSHQFSVGWVFGKSCDTYLDIFFSFNLFISLKRINSSKVGSVETGPTGPVAMPLPYHKVLSAYFKITDVWQILCGWNVLEVLDLRLMTDNIYRVEIYCHKDDYYDCDNHSRYYFTVLAVIVLMCWL